VLVKHSSGTRAAPVSADAKLFSSARSCDTMTPMRRWISFGLTGWLGVVVLPSAWSQEIPLELLDDPHFREEFGINEITAPSIENVFRELDEWKDVSWARYGREIPADHPKERGRLALSLGRLIAEGFFITQSEDREKLEQLGSAMVRHAAALGTGTTLRTHGKALLEFSQRGEWEKLRAELAKTQRDVQMDLIRLRDVDAVHLLSLGGWLRAVEIICAAAAEPDSAERAEILRRIDVVRYFAEELETLHPVTQREDYIAGLRKGLADLLELLEASQEAGISENRLREIRQVVDEMAHWAYGT